MPPDVDETAFRALISGERRGAIAAAQRGGLGLLSLFYGLGVRVRNRAFDLGWKTTHRAAVPVISVGNITAGGTGKTPFVAFLANWFRKRGVHVGLLSRGYRAARSPASHSDGRHGPGVAGSIAHQKPGFCQANDESLVLDCLCPGVPHLQLPDRVAGAKRAVAEHGVDLLILDDGFQHRRLHRDLDVVLVDALSPFGYGRLLPRGLLREPLSGLRRADLIVLTRVDQCSPGKRNRILDALHRYAPRCEIAEVAFRPHGLVDSAGNTAALSSLAGRPVVAFCGIGNPGSFRRTLHGCDVREFRAFPDHHHYTAADLAAIAASIERTNSALAVTTLKDLVKIDASHIAGRPLWAVQIAAEFQRGRAALEQRLESLAPALHRNAA